MSVFSLLVIVHSLAATVWTGGHLMLDLGVLPKALRALAIHARLRLMPHLRDDNLAPLAWHIRGITALAIAFVVAGAGIRLGGFG